MRNTVLVTFDSLRADHCGFMGYDRETTPTLDAMAREGLSFTNAISPGPSTPESMPVVFTGEYPVPAGEDSLDELVGRRATIRHHMGARETLAERFSRAGYATAGFTPNPYTARYFGFDAGFDRFEDFMDGSRAKLFRGFGDGVLGRLPSSSVLPFRVLLNWSQREEVFKPWTAFYDEVVAWADSAPEPYFLWVLLMDTHDPYLAPAEYRSQSRWAMYHANWRLWRQGHRPPFDPKTHERLVRAYDDSIAFADAFLDRLLVDLSGDDPLVVVHGDHGEAFGEHGTYGHHPYLYEENVHVPLVVGGGPSEAVGSPISLRNAPELIWTLANDEPFERADGPACARTLDGERIAVRGRRWKYIRNGEKEEELYAIDDGSGEEVQLDDPSSLQTLRKLTDRWGWGHVEREAIVGAARHVEVD